MGFMLCGVLVLAAKLLGAAQQRPPILEQVAKTYGIDSWDKIEAIRYTWNIEIPGLFKASHKWEWEPKTGKIIYESTDKDGKLVKVTYDSSQLSSQPDQVKNEVEPAFVNDNYWLLFPFHAYWDKSASAIDQGKFNLPVGPGIGRAGSGEVSRRSGVTRPATPGTSTSVKTTASCTLFITAAAPRSRAASSQPGQVTRRQARFSSQRSTAAPPTASRCTSSSRTWRSGCGIG